MRRTTRPLLLIALLTGCATTAPEIPSLTGSWGGTHVGLAFDQEGGRLDYDCATGTIDGPVIPNSIGEFHEKGTHTPGSGGPVRQDDVPLAYPALYHGRVKGDRMTLRVIVPSTGAVIGPLELRLGAEPVLMRCL